VDFLARPELKEEWDAMDDDDKEYYEAQAETANQAKRAGFVKDAPLARNNDACRAISNLDQVVSLFCCVKSLLIIGQAPRHVCAHPGLGRLLLCTRR
jgi:hypothetical protein